MKKTTASVQIRTTTPALLNLNVNNMSDLQTEQPKIRRIVIELTEQEADDIHESLGFLMEDNNPEGYDDVDENKEYHANVYSAAFKLRVAIATPDKNN